MSIVFITEKPSVAQEYKKVLKINQKEKTDGYVEGFSPIFNKNVIVTWAVGHLVVISSPEKQNPNWSGNWSKDKLPMIPSTFKYEPQVSTEKQFKIVKSIYTRKDIEAIYYAGDSGREGIYIQALIRNQIFKTAPKFEEKVVWIDSFTEEAILNGIKTAKPYSTYQNMIDSGYARAMIDWLIGMNFTESFTLTSGSGRLINTGRVMTPTLAMIVERQEQIDNFKKTSFYGVKADDFALWKDTGNIESRLLYNENGFIKKEDAEKMLQVFNNDKFLKVKKVNVQTKTEYAPLLFNLADLQAFCSRKYKISPSETLSIAQSLYEKKLTTYPRTDCRYLSSAVQKDYKNKFAQNIPNRYVDDNKITDHYAIIPTFYNKNASLSPMEKKVYEEIEKRYLDTLEKPFIYDAVSINYIHKNNEMFFESFRKVKQYGFKKELIEEKENEKEIPAVDDIVKVNLFSLRELETKPPESFDTGKIIKAMEGAGKLIEDEDLRNQIKTCGIGTSATRAGIIEKLIEKKFITVDKKQKVTPTDFGKAVLPIIKKYDEALISPIKTAELEEKLNSIAEGKLTLENCMVEVQEYIRETTQKILENNTIRIENENNSNAKHKCPNCNNDLKFGRYGWYCDCKFSFNLEICNHKMKESDLEDLLKKGQTKTYSFKSKAGKSFKAKIIYDKENNKISFKFDNSNNTNNTKTTSNKTTKKTTSFKKDDIKNPWGSKRTVK